MIENKYNEYTTIHQKVKGYYLFNEFDSTLQCYEIKSDSSLEWKSQSKLILDKINKNIFEILDLRNHIQFKIYYTSIKVIFLMKLVILKMPVIILC